MRYFLFLGCFSILALIVFSLRNEKHVKEFYLNWRDREKTQAEWRCVYVDKFEPSCDDEGYNYDFKAEGYSAWFNITSKNKIYSFTTRRPRRIEACEEYIKVWKEIASDPNICFFAEKHRPEEDENLQQQTDWTIDKLLSTKGHWSYFERETEE